MTQTDVAETGKAQLRDAASCFTFASTFAYKAEKDDSR